jgi:hypothetical protein
MAEIADLVVDLSLPLCRHCYQGFGEGLEADAGTRL